MGIACMTVLTKISLLGKFKGQITQLESFYFILSNVSYEEIFFSFPTPRGIPRYLDDKDPFEKPRIRMMFL